MPIVQLDWNKIKSKLDDDTALFALTLRQASMLLGLSEQLTWQKTFRLDNYDWADKDDLDADVADLQRNLAMPTNLVDIIQYIDEIEDLLRALQFTAGCCNDYDVTDGDEYTDDVEDGVGDVPANVISAGYATDVSDWAGFDDYKCVISHVTVAQMDIRLRMLAPYVDAAGAVFGGLATVVAIVTTIFTGGLTAMTLGILAASGSVALLYHSLTSGSFLEALAQNVVDNQEELACAIYHGDGPNGAFSNLTAKINELFSPAEALKTTH